MFGLAIEVPAADAVDVAAVEVLGLEVEVLEDELDILPVLHLHRICLVDNDHLDRREEIVVLLSAIFVVDDSS